MMDSDEKAYSSVVEDDDGIMDAMAKLGRAERPASVVVGERRR